MTSYDTIIIGAGMSGLAAGIRLAHFDQKVCILERHYTIGGLNSFYRMSGRDFDVGLHAMTNFARPGDKRGPLAKLIRQLRFRWEDFKLAEQIGRRFASQACRLISATTSVCLRARLPSTSPTASMAFDA